MRTHRPVHPGELLKYELEDLGVTPTELARQIQVPANRITMLIQGKRDITADTARRLGHWFRMPAQFWMNYQSQYDLAKAETEGALNLEDLPTRPEVAV